MKKMFMTSILAILAGITVFAKNLNAENKANTINLTNLPSYNFKAVDTLYVNIPARIIVVNTDTYEVGTRFKNFPSLSNNVYYEYNNKTLTVKARRYDLIDNNDITIYMGIPEDKDIVILPGSNNYYIKK